MCRFVKWFTLNEDKRLKVDLVMGGRLCRPPIDSHVKKKDSILKVEYLKKFKILKKSEKNRTIPSYSEHLKIGTASLGENLRKEIGPKVCREYE